MIFKSFARRRYARQHLLLIALVACYLAAGAGIEGLTGTKILWDEVWVAMVSAGLTGSTVVLITFLPFLLVFLLSRISVLIFGRTARTSTWADYRRHLTLEKTLGIFTVWALFRLLVLQFLGFKGTITVFHPFSWDLYLMNLDRTLHFGRHPWELLHPFLGRPAITWSLDKAYYAWFGVNALFFHWMAWREWDTLRSRFFLSYFSLWVVLGTAAAMIFSSAGPVYYEAVVGDGTPFGPLVSYLQEVGQTHPLIALNVSEVLWTDYMGQGRSVIDGISAMPSLHVAVPVLLTLVAFRLKPWVGVVFGFYSLLVLLGSVHLAWHYAVDGYTVIIAVPVLWALSGWVVRLTDAT